LRFQETDFLSAFSSAGRAAFAPNLKQQQLGIQILRWLERFADYVPKRHRFNRAQLDQFRQIKRLSLLDTSIDHPRPAGYGDAALAQARL